MKKRTYTRLTTNQVTASYSYLREPDSGREFSDDKYKVTILIDKADEDGLAIIRNACAKAAADEWPEGAPANMRSPVRDGAEKSAELADYFLVPFKSKQQPKLFDATGAALDADINIFSGDKIRVAGAAGAYVAGANKGVTLYLNGVQLIEKRQDAEDDLFGAVDGGFVNPTSASEAAEAPVDGSNFNF